MQLRKTKTNSVVTLSDVRNKVSGAPTVAPRLGGSERCRLRSARVTILH